MLKENAEAVASKIKEAIAKAKEESNNAATLLSTRGC